MSKDNPEPPYQIERQAADRIVVSLPEFLDEPRTEAHAIELEGLIDEAEVIALDATRSVAINTEWLRFFYRLTAIAAQSRKTVGIVGLSEVLQESTDVLGFRDKLEMFGRIGEVWEA